MVDKPKRPKKREGVLSSFNMAIDGLNLAKEFSSITPAKPVFGSVAALLTMIRDTMINEKVYVELGFSCADICRAIERGIDERKLDDFSGSVRDAIDQLKATVAEMQEEITKQGGRHRISRFFHARTDKETIAGWKSDLNRILHFFNAELAMNIYTTVIDVHQNVSKPREVADGQNSATQNSTPQGELPPPPPKIFFGRDELIQRIADLAENLTSIALIGAGGIGKTSAVLTALHDDRIKERFGDNRWFIRCDQFPASYTYFLRQLSKVIGAGIENPEDLTPLRRYLSSKDMIIVLDNAEYILDVRGTNTQKIYAIVDELSQFNNVCLAITSRISTIPPHCETVNVPTLSTEAAQDAFYRIYRLNERSDPTNDILKQLGFHPLSITLLATAAQQNQWDVERLTTEWERQRPGILHTRHSRSLAAAIEFSLASPMFQDLGPDARPLLEAVAFFPQGISEDNVGWLLPSISDVPNVFDKFCTLSLTYRSCGFVTMLAPLRDYLRPKDPMSSPFLSVIKEHYFNRLSADPSPRNPNFDGLRWITLEDANIEHLLNTLISIDPGSESVWNACTGFMDHLYWHKPRLVMLGPKIEALLDNHPFKARCLNHLSRLLYSVGNWVEQKRVLTHALRLWKEQENDHQVAETLGELSDANRLLNLKKEGIQQAEEASGIFGRLGETIKQAECSIILAWAFHDDDQLDAAEEAAFRAMNLLPEKGEEPLVCHGHRVLGNIYQSKGESEKAIQHFKEALEMASSINWSDQVFGVHFSLALLFSGRGRFNEAHTHIGHARSHVGDDAYLLARASWLQAEVWVDQRMFEEAESAAARALCLFEKSGATDDAEETRRLLGKIGRRSKK